MQQTVEVIASGEGPFVFVATYLPLKRWRDMLEFIRLSSQVAHQMRQTPGVVRFSLRAKPLQKKFWTCSVWRAAGADLAIDTFISTGAHQLAMKALPRLTTAGQSFTRWTSASPVLDWKDVLKRMAAARV